MPDSDQTKEGAEITAESRSLDALVRAIWAAGFRAGKAAGADEAMSFEWGNRPGSKTPEQAWDEDVKWRLESEHSYRLELDNPEHWNDVP